MSLKHEALPPGQSLDTFLTAAACQPSIHHRTTEKENVWVVFITVIQPPVLGVFVGLMWQGQMSIGANFDLAKLVLSLSCTKGKKQNKTFKVLWFKVFFLWYVFNFSTAKLSWSNLYALKVISKTWWLLKEHLSGTTSFHVSRANYCRPSTPKTFPGQQENEG